MATPRYLLYSLDGNGRMSLIEANLVVLEGAAERTLSKPGSITGRIPYIIPGSNQLNPAWSKVLAWNTLIVREYANLVQACIVTEAVVNGTDLEIEAQGFKAYLNGLPCTDYDLKLFEVDASDVVRLMWVEAQKPANGNIGVIVDSQPSGVKVGIRGQDELKAHGDIKDSDGNIALPAAAARPEIKPQPVVLAWHSTPDMGRQMDTICAGARLDYLEETSWASNGNPRLFLRLGSPGIARDRRNMRFVVGENVIPYPEIQVGGDSYATEIQVLGAGEGPKKLRARGGNKGSNEWIRRVRLRVEPNVNDVKTLEGIAARDAARLQGPEPKVQSFVIVWSKDMPPGSLSPGDRIIVRGLTGGGDIDAMQCRITSIQYKDSALGTSEVRVISEG